MWIRKGNVLINLDNITEIDVEYGDKQCDVYFFKNFGPADGHECISYETERPQQLAEILEDKITDALRKGLPVLELSDGDDEYSI